MRTFLADLTQGIVASPYNYGREQPVRTVMLQIAESEAADNAIAQCAMAAALYIRKLERQLVTLRQRHADFDALETVRYTDEDEEFDAYFTDKYFIERLAVDMRQFLISAHDDMLRSLVEETLSQVEQRKEVLRSAYLAAQDSEMSEEDDSGDATRND